MWQFNFDPMVKWNYPYLLIDVTMLSQMWRSDWNIIWKKTVPIMDMSGTLLYPTSHNFSMNSELSKKRWLWRIFVFKPRDLRREVPDSIYEIVFHESRIDVSANFLNIDHLKSPILRKSAPSFINSSIYTDMVQNWGKGIRYFVNQTVLRYK